MTDEARRALGQALRELREAVGLTQGELGRVTNRSVSSISDFENGRWKRLPEPAVVSGHVDACLHHGDLRSAVAREWRARIAGLVGAIRALDDVAKPTVVDDLPRDTSAFTAREDELTILRQTADRGGRRRVVAIHAVDGMPGVGKTALAVHAAHMLRRQYPDGRFFLDLRGHSPGLAPLRPAAALRALLLAAGVGERDVPDDPAQRAERWRATMTGKRAVVVLDNAGDWPDVEPLLPGSPESLVIVTSRRRLPIPDAVTISLDVLAADDAVVMLGRVAGLAFGAQEPVGELVELAGRLPLAISLLGARLRNRRLLPVSALVEEMRESRSRLAMLSDRDRGVAAAFDVSFRALPEEHRRFLRLLGLHPGAGIDAYAAAAIARLSFDDAKDRLLGLYDNHLLDEQSFDRFRMHDLVADFVRQLGTGLDATDEPDALVRLLLYFECAGRKADDRLGGVEDHVDDRYIGPVPDMSDRRAALVWLAEERQNLVGCVRAALDGHPNHVAELVDVMTRHLRLAGPWDEAGELHRLAAEAARRVGDIPRESRAMLELGTAAKNQGDYPMARQALVAAEQLHSRHTPDAVWPAAQLELGSVSYLTGDYERARQQFHAAAAEAGDDLGTAAGALLELGTLAFLEDEYEKAEATLLQAFELSRALQRPEGEAQALKNLGNTYYFKDEYDRALRAFDKAAELYTGLGAQLGQAQTISRVGSIQRLRGEFEPAVASLEDAIRRCRLLGERSLEAEASIDLGAALAMLDRFDEAVPVFERSLALYGDLGEDLGLACALKEFAELHRMRGDVDTAVTHLTRSRELYATLPDRLGLIAVDNTRGRVALNVGDTDTAADLFENALQGARTIRSPLEEGIALTGLGRVALQRQDRPLGRRLLQDAHTVFTRIGAAEARETARLLDTQPT